jgi:tRNA-dihydrouridine synthase
MSPILLSSALQGFTDFRFRNAFNKFFGAIDIFYSPYIRLNGNFEIKKSYEKDILPENNSVSELVPQIITNNADEFLFVANFVKQLGYKELNWNLGCPYPMVTKRNLGAGLINDVQKIDEILNKIYSESDINISIKMRLGNVNSDEIFKVLPIFDKYAIKNITIHPRIAKQLYKGEVDLNAFKKCIENTKHKVIYNGDINSVSKFNELQNLFPTIDHWMIGRGLISDPFLPQMIKNNNFEYPKNRIEMFAKFHDTLFYEYSQTLSGPNHIIMKMFSFWEYFALSFPNSHKTLKKIKKAKSINTYSSAVREFF